MEIGGFARWAPVLLMEGHPLGGLAGLPWLHQASRPEGRSRRGLRAAGRLLLFRGSPRPRPQDPAALLDAFSPFHFLVWFKFSSPSLPLVLFPLLCFPFLSCVCVKSL